MSGEEQTFARLRLVGGRFEDDGMPVEALGELVAYRDLVVGVAEELFRSRHPGRQRLPAGFTDRLQLRLKSVERGSAIPVLRRVNLPGTLLTPIDEFAEARDLIVDAVAAVAGGGQLPGAFPREALVLFNRFGQGLRAGESIEMADDSVTSARYTQDVRRRLVLEYRSSYQDEVRDIAWIDDLDAQHMRCLLRLRGGPRGQIPAPVDELTFDPFKEALAPNSSGSGIYISGTGVFDARRVLTRLDSVHDVGPVPEDLAALDSRIEELTGMKDGWLDGNGTAPAAATGDRAYVTLAEMLRLGVPRPHLYPTFDGGVQAEWTAEPFEISLTFNPDGSGLAAAINTDTGAEIELPETSPELLANFVRHPS